MLAVVPGGIKSGPSWCVTESPFFTDSVSPSTKVRLLGRDGSVLPCETSAAVPGGMSISIVSGGRVCPLLRKWKEASLMTTPKASPANMQIAMRLKRTPRDTVSSFLQQELHVRRFVG